MNKSFHPATIQEELLLASITHRSNRSQTNQHLVQDYQLAKQIDSPTLDYFRNL